MSRDNPPTMEDIKDLVTVNRLDPREALFAHLRLMVIGVTAGQGSRYRTILTGSGSPSGCARSDTHLTPEAVT